MSSNRDVEVIETSETNSILYWGDLTSILKLSLNMSVITVVYHIPIPQVRNFFYRILGTDIGKNTDFSAKTDVYFPELVSIGENCIIAGEAKLLAHEFLQGEYRKGKIEIKDNVVIGQDSLILPGVKIGENAIVGAGSVVTKDVEANTVVAGNPARKIRDRDL